MSQNVPRTALTAVGTLTVGGLANSPLSTLVVQATGAGTGLTFNVLGLPAVGGTAVALPMYPLASGVVGSPVVTASADGLWIVPIAGFVAASLNLSAIGASQTEYFSLTTSPALFPLV